MAKKTKKAPYGEKVNEYSANKTRFINDNNTITNGKQFVDLNNKQKIQTIIGDRISIKCKNKKQRDFLKMIDEKEIILCKGPAGVGKSYLSVAQALHLLMKPDNLYEKIYIITPLVESDEPVGFLKGTLADKALPYLFSTYFLIDKIIGKRNREILVDKGIIEHIAMAFLRGVNIENAILLYEEAQNSSIKGMKTLLTRISENAKFIISGDIEQIDRFCNKNESGLYDVYNRLQGIDKIGLFEFNNEDIVRNPLITVMLDRYNDVNKK